MNQFNGQKEALLKNKERSHQKEQLGLALSMSSMLGASKENTNPNSLNGDGILLDLSKPLNPLNLNLIK